MADAGKQVAHMTPGRRGKRASNNLYFDVGKVGRKTGITLRDTGIRDEHGLEPVSGIFSSPVIDEHAPTGTIDNEDTEDEDTLLPDSAPEVNEITVSRKTPRFPPARASTPRHTNIGSPKRMSSAKPAVRPNGSEDGISPAQSKTQPPPNRVLNFTSGMNRARKSMNSFDTQSPFRPKKNLRRSHGPINANLSRQSPTLPGAADAEPSGISAEQVDRNLAEAVADVEQSIESIAAFDDDPLVMDDGRSDAGPEDQIRISLDGARAMEAPQTPSVRSVGGLRSSSELQQPEDHIRPSPPDAIMVPPPTSAKRSRSSLRGSQIDGDSRLSLTQAEGDEPPPKRKRGRPRKSEQTMVTLNEAEVVADQNLLANGDESVIDDHATTQAEEQLEPPEDGSHNLKRSKGKRKARQALVDQDPNRITRRSTSPSAAAGHSAGRGHRTENTTSNVHLRATTPFEDAAHRTSRSGRNLIKPLKYWENESRIWKRGAIEGIVRADPIPKPETKSKRRRRGKRQDSKLEDVQEDSETESLQPDEWEETHGVISGNVAKWNPATNAGDPNDPVREDLAFAASSIVTRDVPGAVFKFAKIMTIPFFGAGIVEVPPEGFKRAKNSGKMQLLFFVHEGKVMVEVGATGMEVNQFALSKGGVWSVPRGNNYAIINESRTRSAKIFFAQGWMVKEDEE